MAQLQSTGITGSLTVTTGSATELLVTNTGVRIGNVVTDTHTVTGSLNISGSLGTVGTITATTLIVQTITSSVATVTGSTKFGTLTSNTHQFTGSIYQSGSEAIFGGNVGISTATPGYPLDVRGAGTIARITDGTSHMTFYAGSSLNEIATVSPMLLTVSGSERMRITTSGSVGIGTTVPTTRLEVRNFAPDANRTSPFDILTLVAESNNAPYEGWGGGIVFKNRSYTAGLLTGARFRSVIYYSGNAGQEYGAGLAFDVTANTGSALTEAVRIKYDGNVGIATTAPIGKLQIGGTSGNLLTVGTLTNDWGGDVAIGVTTGNGIIISKVNTNNDQNRVLVLSRDDAGGGGTVIGYGPNGLSNNIGFRLQSTGSSYFIGGNVGIGTASPLTRLHVNYSTGTGLTLSNTGANQYAEIRFQASESSAYIFKSSNGYTNYGGANALNIYNEGQIAFHSSTTSNIMYLTAAGNVGIGTTSPSSKLHVSGGIQVISYTNSTINSSNAALRIDNGGSQSMIYFTISGVQRGSIRVDSSGNMVFNSTASNFYFNNDFGSNSTINFINTNTTFMSVTSGGSIGIGTTVPVFKLQTDHGTTTQYVSSFRNTADNLQIKIGTTTGALLNIQGATLSDSAYNISLQADGGNVGVGITSPTAKLHISGSSNSVVFNADSNTFGGRYALLPGLFAVGTLGNGYPEAGYNFGTSGSEYHKLGNDTAWAINYGNGNVMSFKYAAASVGAFTWTTLLTLTTAGGLSATSFTGSLLGTASFATNVGSTGNAFVQGGNSFGAQALLGTNDVQNLAFETSGSVRMLISGSSGNIGIGSTVPDATFNIVTPAADTTGNAFSFRGSNGKEFVSINKLGFIRSRASDTNGANFHFQDNNGTKRMEMAVDSSIMSWYSDALASNFLTFQHSSGNIGIRTTAPTATLHVSNSAATTVLQVDGGVGMTGGWNRNSTFSATYPVLVFNSANTRWGGIGYDFTAGMRFWVSASSSDVPGTSTALLNLLHGGFVGIGTTESSYRLRVQGQSYYSDTLFFGSGGNLSWTSGYSDGTTQTFSGNSIALITPVAGSPRLFISSSGNVGIGLTTPLYKLHVADSGVPAIGVFRDLDVVSVGPAGQGIDFGARSGSNFLPGAAIYGQLDNPGSTGGLTFQTRTANSLTTKMFINSSGNVGINSTSPARKLDVNGTSIFRDFTTVVSSNGNAVSNITWLSTDSGIMNIYTGGSATVQLNSSGISYFNGGSVGIGTAAPSASLHIYGTATIPSTSDNSGSFAIGTTNGVQLFIGTYNASPYGAFFQTKDANNAGPYNYPILLNPVNGNVGVGTTNPVYKLHVSGTSAILKIDSTGATFGNPSINLFQGAIDTILTATNTGLELGTYSNHPILFKVNNTTEAMRIVSGGNVGVGTTNPKAKFHVLDSATFGTIAIGNYSYPTLLTSNASSGEFRVDNRSSAASGFISFYPNGQDTVSGSEAMRIDTNGNVGIGTFNVNAPLEVYRNGAAADTTGGGISLLRYQLAGSYRGSSIFHRYIDAGGSYDSMIFSVSEGSNPYIATTTALDSRVKMIINVNGSVGIGTTAPTSRLEVRATAPDADRTLPFNILTLVGEQGNAPYEGFGGGIVFKNRSYTAGMLTSARMRSVIYFSGNPGQNYGAGMAFDITPTTSSALTEAVRIKYDGNVGINQTNPSFKLDVNGDIYANGDIRSQGIFRDYQGEALLQTNTSAVTQLGSGGAGTPRSLSFLAGNTQRMIVSASGVVGIGTSASPTIGGFTNTRLYVKQIADGGSGGGLHIEQSSNDNVAYFGFDGSAFSMGTSYRSGGAYTPINITTSGTSRIYITTGGQVGLTNTSPQYRLDVNGGTGGGFAASFGGTISTGVFSGIHFGYLETANTSYRKSALVFERTDNHSQGGNASGKIYMLLDNRSSVSATTLSAAVMTWDTDAVATLGSARVGIASNSPAYALDVNGTIRATGDVIAYSDARVKENVETITNALDKVTLLRGVTYNRIDSKDKSRKVGVIAQEILEVLPEVVTQDPENGNYNVAYGNIVGVLIEAIKELKAEIEELKRNK